MIVDRFPGVRSARLIRKRQIIMQSIILAQTKRYVFMGAFGVLLLNSSLSKAQEMPAEPDFNADQIVEDVVVDVEAPEGVDLSEAIIDSNVQGEAQPIEEEPDVYFDSASTGLSDVVQDIAPVKVDPRQQPGQSFIIVKKHSEAGSYESRIVAANRALKLGRDASALSMFESLYKSNPRDPRVLMGLAVSQQKSGFKASAIKTYEELLRRAPNNHEAMVNMLGLMKDQYPEVALRKLMHLHEHNPHSPGVAAQIGMAHAKMGRYKEAMRYMGMALSLEPNNATHSYNIAIVADSMGEKNDAIGYYEEALQIDAMHGASRSIPRQVVYDRLAELRRL